MKVVTINIREAFMNTKMGELVHVRFEGVMAQRLVKIDPVLYKKYVVIEHGREVIYYALSKALYGTLRASLLFWRKLTQKMV
mmetsp:Transcript_21699/g.63826  ORF Transcript_21699/g.63826 Transcript_21699/m.63826 type:complete len:82 (+) Transcript_21699:411-656(+)